MMSQFVAQFSSSTRTNSTSQRENNWDNITSFADQCRNLLPHPSLGHLIMFDSAPDYGPGTSINISTSATPTPTTSVTTTLITSPTLTPTPPSPTHTHSSPSNSGAIAGGVVGGVGAVAVACLAIFWLRRKRPQAPSAAFVLDDSPMSAVLSSDDDIYVTPFMPGTPPTPLRLYVRVSTPRSQCLYVLNPFPFLLIMYRTRTTQPHSPGSMEQVRHTFQAHRDITVCPLSDLTPYFCWTSPGSGSMVFTGVDFLFGRAFSSEVIGGQSEPTLDNGHMVSHLSFVMYRHSWFGDNPNDSPANDHIFGQSCLDFL